MAGQTLNIGFDDTDSPRGMCTTFLAYKMVGLLQKQKAEFLDFPRLVRFNPNIPWKTRGNGAVSLRVRTRDPDRTKRQVQEMVSEYSDTENGANPGLVFFEGDVIPDCFAEFGRLALWQLVRRNEAKRFARKNGLDAVSYGNGQGLVGAVGAVGYRFDDTTLELLSYRKRSEFGKPRRISAQSVKAMQERTAPHTFNSFDAKKNRIMISPHGPDPVFYGIRGEDASSLLRAARMIKSDEEPDGFMIFQSNQGTGDHLKNNLNPKDLRPYSSGRISGTVSCMPEMRRGGHVFFKLASQQSEVVCAVYRPTGMAQVASGLVKGDRIVVGGGVRPASRIHPRTLNLEFVEVLHLEEDLVPSNPHCQKCHKNMKSKGKNQGFQCVMCGATSKAKTSSKRPRDLKAGLYLPRASAHRHLSRPAQRIGLRNRVRFGNIPWFYAKS